MAVQTPSRFDDLPAELRNEIYRLCIKGTTTTILPESKQGKIEYRVVHSSSPNMETLGMPGMLQTNRQLRAESKQVFYSVTLFIVHHLDPLVAWLKTLDPACKSAIQNIVLRGYTDLKEGHWIVDMLHDALHNFEQHALQLAFQNANNGLDPALLKFETWTKGYGKKLQPKDT